LSKVSSSKAINLRTIGPLLIQWRRAEIVPVRNQRHALLLSNERRFPMVKLSATASLVAIAILIGPIGSLAQSGGGSAGAAASGPSAGTGSAVGSPNAGSAGAGTAGVNGVPSGPANAGGLNNSGNDPSGAGNSGKVVSKPPPGTNSAGTANSPGSSAAGSSMTTGSAGSRAGTGGTAATGPQTKGDISLDKEDKDVDRRVKSICRGC
jgi:hypothetical protein